MSVSGFCTFHAGRCTTAEGLSGQKHEWGVFRRVSVEECQGYLESCWMGDCDRREIVSSRVCTSLHWGCALLCSHSLHRRVSMPFFATRVQPFSTGLICHPSPDILLRPDCFHPSRGPPHMSMSPPARTLVLLRGLSALPRRWCYCISFAVAPAPLCGQVFCRGRPLCIC